MMKEVIYKKNFEKYYSQEHRDYNPIKEDKPRSSLPEFGIEYVYGATEKHPLFVPELSYEGEEMYNQQFNNPIFSVSKKYVMIVVEKDGDKVAIKLFLGSKHRGAGNQWFRTEKDVEYISVNTKTGDVYHGYIHGYQKKKKRTKSIRRNCFFSYPIDTFKSKAKNILTSFVDNSYEEITIAISEFMFHIDQRDNSESLNYSNRLLRFYLNKRNIKYPNNFGIYANELSGPEIKKILKKNNKLVDAVMTKYSLSGKRVKRALHVCNRINIPLYQSARALFGDVWMNQDSDNIILDLLNNPMHSFTFPPLFLELISKEELKRVYKLFKEVYLYQNLDTYTFQDHIRMYVELKMYGLTDLKWTISERTDFRKEHLDWTDKLQHYKRGDYTRHYPEYMYEKISKPIFEEYYPILLNNSSNYNEESNTQSNCVKGYIGKPSCLIVSLRKGGADSEERATVEYRLTKKDDIVHAERIQSLGKYNEKLDKMWNLVLLNLDLVILSCIRDPRFVTVKLTKKCNNGSILESDTYWNNDGILRWTTQNIEENHNYFFNANYNFR